MLSRWVRNWDSKLFHPINCFLMRLGVTPNGLTAAGLVLAVLSGACLAVDRLLLGAGCLLLSGLCDALDGEMARQQIQPSRLGPFIDSVADHYGDFAIYAGLVWWALNGKVLFDPSPGNHMTVLLVLIAMFGSLVGSHIRSRAAMVGVDTKNIGAFTRMERTLVLLIGLASGWVLPALVVLALANNVSAIERVVYVLREKDRATGT